jgi:K(+)-stimulated pyrophosphate-energized sodium pump
MLPVTMKMEFLVKEVRIFPLSILCNLGLFVGGAISSVTEYYTGLGTKPVMAIVQKSTGAGTNV